jgi:acyl-CoA synthetase (AMP-forming)/AMP-acid ligase II
MRRARAELNVASLPRSPVPPSVLDEAETVVGALTALVGTFPDHPGLIFLDGRGRERRVTYAELWERARQLQSVFTANGLSPGGVALLALPTSLELTAAYFGAMLAGGLPALVVTPFHRFADPHVYTNLIGSIMRVAEADLFYCSEEAAAICRDNTALPMGRLRILTPAAATFAGSARPARTPQPGDLAMIQYTSGTTGRQKGVLLTHRAILNNMRATREGLGVYADDVSVNWAPLYHDMGLIDTFLRPLFSGSTVVLMPTIDFVRNPALWLWAIHHYRGTISWAPNFAYQLCAARIFEAELRGLDLSSWRAAVNGSEPCLAHTIEAFAERFAPYGYAPEAMTPVWGVAEAVCIATAQPVAERPRIETVDREGLAKENVARPATGEGLPSVSIGRFLPYCEVEVRDPGGRVMPEREVGKLWIRTRSLFEGYQRDPELTARVLVDGWVDTGDRGYIAGGHVFFVSREKDLIIIGGEKYAPHDVETAIGRVPGVREGCAVSFGVTNPERGTEDVAAVVETRETNENAVEALREAIRREVAAATGIGLRYVILVPPGGINKTTSGKLARGATRERYADQLGEPPVSPSCLMRKVLSSPEKKK